MKGYDTYSNMIECKQYQKLVQGAKLYNNKSKVK